MLLPKKVGSFTLMRRLDGGRSAEAYVATLEEPAGKEVVARKVPSTIARDRAQQAFIESRVRDLMTVRHASLVPVLDVVEVNGDLWVLEEWSDSVSIRAAVARMAREKVDLPRNVFLHVATQVCNALEALHARPAPNSGRENLLHLGIRPEAVQIDRDGRVRLGRFGFTRSPVPNPGSSSGDDVAELARYLSPEQTQADPRLSPASDIFALGGLLFELLVGRPLFDGPNTLETIQSVRRAQVTTQLLEVKEALPGLDRVLFRALSVNPRHRYQRAFVLREDLRGLMSGFSFADVEEVSQAFFAPVFLDATSPDLSDDFGEEVATHVGSLPDANRSSNLRPKTFLPEFDDEEPPPPPPRPPEKPSPAPLRPSDPHLADTPRDAPRSAPPRSAPPRSAPPRSAPPRSAPPRSAPPRSAPPRSASQAASAPPASRASGGRPAPARGAGAPAPRASARLRPPPNQRPANQRPPSSPPPKTPAASSRAPAPATRPPPVSSSAPPLRSAIDEDEEPTIGPSQLTLETLKEQLSFDDVVRRGPGPVPIDDDDERQLFEDSETVVGLPDEPTHRATISRGADDSFVVEPAPRPVEATLRSRNRRATLVPPDGPLPASLTSRQRDEAVGDDVTWNPRADLPPQTDWGGQTAWSPSGPGFEDQTDRGGLTDRGERQDPSVFDNFVDEDEVDTREHAAALWERRAEEESSDDPATAWNPGLAGDQGIRVFDDPTFDAGVDATFDAGFDRGFGASPRLDDATVDLGSDTPHVPTRELLDEPSRSMTWGTPVPEPREATPPPREMAPPPSAPPNERPEVPPLPPRSPGLRMSTTSSLPSFDPEGVSGPLPAGRPERLSARVSVPPASERPDPRSLGPRTPVPRTSFPGESERPERSSRFTAAPPGAGDPLQPIPSGLTRDDILAGGIVSDEIADEEPAVLGWRTVFALVAAAGFFGAVVVVGAIVFIIQQPGISDYVRGLASGGEDDVAAEAVVEEVPAPPVVVVDVEADDEPAAEPEEDEPDVEAEMEALRADAVVRTRVDPSETFAAVRAPEPEPAPAPRPAPPPAPATEAPAPPPLIPSRAVGPTEGAVSRGIEPAPSPDDGDDEPRRRRRDREDEDDDPARVGFELPPPPAPAEPPPGSSIPPTEMDRWSSSAFEGQLSAQAVSQLAAVEVDDPQFTRARTLLYLNAKQRGDVRERRGHLRLLMTKPENQYNPVLLVEQAQDAMEQKQYGEALELATEANQYWARMPSDLVFSRKALIYEIEALAHTGLFFESEGADLEHLTGAIRGWEKYLRHVRQKGRDAMARRAEDQLERLRDLEERLQ